jgi:hypothetical protein
MRTLPEVVEVRPYLLQSAQSTKFSGAYRMGGGWSRDAAVAERLLIGGRIARGEVTVMGMIAEGKEEADQMTTCIDSITGAYGDAV